MLFLDPSTKPMPVTNEPRKTASVVKAIGAQSTYSECPTGPYAKIIATGDEPRSFLEPLAQVVQSGVNVLIWAGDLGKKPPVVSF